MTAVKYQASWCEAELADICSKPQYGYTTKSSSKGYVKFLRTTDITKGSFNWDEVPFCETVPDDVNKYQLEHRDIVISRAGSIGFSSLLMEPPVNSVFASYLIRFKPSKQFSERFLKRFLESYGYWSQLALMSAGNAVQNVNAQKLSKIIVPVAPLAEQKVIADKLDTLLAQVENTKARLERIPQILKRFRQSVLAAAVSGRLTEEWKSSPPNAEWQNIQLGNLVISSANGLSKRRGDKGIDTTILRLADFKDAIRKFGAERKIKLTEKEIEKYSLHEGDVLVIRVNGSTDLAGRFIEYIKQDEIEGFCDHFIRMRVDTNRLSPKYLTYVANEGLGRNYLESSLSTSAGQNTINQGSIKGLRVPLPSLEEQIEIVRRVGQLFAHADRIEKQVYNALTRVNKLTQSILTKAFRGELTEQWRKDNTGLISGENSAEALLQRIKAERSQTKQARSSNQIKASV